MFLRYRKTIIMMTHIRHFRPYLLDRKFIPRTEHSSLKWLKQLKEPEGQMAWWLEQLQEYDFEIVHRAGSKHANAYISSLYVTQGSKQCI